MESAYLGAVDATLSAIRKLHDEGTRAPPPAWLTAFYGDVDAMRMPEFLTHFTPDGRVVFGNNPPAVGRQQIEAAIGGLWSAIAGLRHQFVNVWDNGAGAVLEASITYDRKDGKSVVLPCVSVFDRRDGKVSDLRIHMDIGPVFAP
jgi:ketosteroid isomerase-like protein